MMAAAEGTAPSELARQFGFSGEAGANRAVVHARNGVYPFDIFTSVAIERRVLEALTASVLRTLTPRAADSQVLGVTGWYIRSGGLLLQLRDAGEAAQAAALDPDWEDLRVADLGKWTEPMTMRAEGQSFHDIADALGFDDFFDANQLIATHRVRYEQGCAARLRRAQIRVLDRELRDVWDEATGPARLSAATRALRILERRARVRGIYLTFNGPLIDHAPEPHRCGQ